MKPEHHFHLKNGGKLKDLFDLAKSLEEMPEEVFNHHVNEHRNDFYNWIRDVIGDQELALKIKRSKTKKEMQQHLGEIIKGTVDEQIKEKQETKTEKETKQAAKEAKEPELNVSVGKPAKKLKSMKKEAKTIKKEPPKTMPKQTIKTATHPATKPHQHCPYKTFHCGVLEFMIGVLVGLLLEFIIITML